VRNKSGTSKYWFSMQVVNSNTAVKTLDVSIDGGNTWKSTIRRGYNYFEKSGNDGFGTDKVDVRITSSNRKQIRISGVSVASEASMNASGNF
jgi:expansin (peptidoglycan-binding protein)